ncbi:hypothetical protein SAMN06295912_10821 [Sphingomonas laterariae]|uniref:Uncharacterized protein n=2 Tax=Edaphosphingomonas laterariae TaxID=861865 RepID=A0A239F1R8_9SPHN|nr:hypothetical protein SAMN06295912_10821 [Sphingomonas laterariae]
MFDLTLTSRLAQLAAIDVRDDSWTDSFFAAAWNAAIALPAAAPETGPDGFAYLRIDIPEPGTVFDSQSLAHLAQDCVDRASGVALFPHPAADRPVFVMSMGLLESLLRYGDWRGDPVDLAEQGHGAGGESGPMTLKAGETILRGAPSSDYLSPAAARAMAAHLAGKWNMARPRVALLANPAMRPTRSLVINRRLASFADEADAQYFAQCVMWHLPPSRALVFMPDGWAEADLFPLGDFT